LEENTSHFDINQVPWMPKQPQRLSLSARHDSPAGELRRNRKNCRHPTQSLLPLQPIFVGYTLGHTKLTRGGPATQALTLAGALATIIARRGNEVGKVDVRFTRNCFSVGRLRIVLNLAGSPWPNWRSCAAILRHASSGYLSWC
jgi:hypothetical protein